MMQTYIGMGNVMKSTQCLSDIGRTHYLIICPPEYPFAPLQKNNMLKGYKTFFCPFEFENRLFPSILGSCCKKTVDTADMELVKFLTGARFPIFQILPEKNAQIASFLAENWKWRMFYSYILNKLLVFPTEIHTNPSYFVMSYNISSLNETNYTERGVFHNNSSKFYHSPNLF